MKPYQRIRRLFHLPLTEHRVDADVAAEVEFHLESRVAELVEAGMAPELARAKAEREFGDVTDARAELARIDRSRVRQTRRMDVFDTIRHELRLAVRALIREPLFSLAVIITLGLGIGVNAAMFGITDRLLFRPPPGIAQPGNVKRIYFTLSTTWAGETHIRTTSQPAFIALQQSLKGVEGVGASFATDATMGRGREATRMRWCIASASFFTTLGAHPVLGRFFTQEEDVPGKEAPVVVLGHAFWQKEFGGDRAILGRQVLIGRRNYTVIGVAAPGFNGVDYEKIDMYAPLSTAGVDQLGEDWNTPNVGWLRLFVRVPPAANLQRIGSDASAIVARSLPVLGDKPAVVTAEPLILAKAPHEAGNMMPETANIALWLSGLSLLVLVIACANVINLLLARVSRRQREVGIRIALGVGRARLISVFMLESMVLAVLGGALGLAMTRWGSGGIRRLLLPDMDWTMSAIDGRVVAYTLLLVGICAMIATVAPALQSLRSDVTASLRSGSRAGSQRSAMRNGLVALQAVISVILLVIAGLFVRSQRNLQQMDKGFDADHVLALNIDTGLLDLTGPQADAMYHDIADRLRRVPGVENAAVAMTVPFWSSMWGRLKADGVDSIPQTKDGGPYYNGVTPEYFATVGTRIVAGRGFTHEDRDGAPKVAVLSQTMARLLWPKQNPLGKCIYFIPDPTCRRVVGVAHDALRDAIEGDVMMYYLPLDQVRKSSFRAVFIRSENPSAVIPAVRRSILEMRGDMPLADVRLLADLMSPRMRQWRLGAVLFTAFGALALMLAALGLYSVIAYDVAQRAREISLRVALGARARHVIQVVVGDSARIVVFGLAIGIAIAMYASKRVGSLLFHVAPWDRTVFAGVLFVLLAAAGFASLVPAVRALRVAPVDALKEE